MLNQGRFSAAFSLVYAIWNNLFRDAITKHSGSPPSPDLSLFQFISYVDGRTQAQTQTLRRLRLQWLTFKLALGTKDPMPLSKNEVRVFYTEIRNLCQWATLSMGGTEKQTRSNQSGEMGT